MGHEYQPPAPKYVPSGKKFLCPNCLKRKPKSEFHHCGKKSQGKHKAGFFCLECEPRRRIEKVRNTIREKKMTKKTQHFAHITKQIREKPIEVPHIAELAEAVMNEFKTDELSPVQAYAKEFKSHFDMAMTHNVGKKTMTDLFAVMKNLIVASTEHRTSAPDVANLTDDEIEDVMTGAAMKMLAANPRALIEMADKMGLKVYDPKILDADAKVLKVMDAVTAKTLAHAVEADAVAVAVADQDYSESTESDEMDAGLDAGDDPLSDGDIDPDEIYEDEESEFDNV